MPESVLRIRILLASPGNLSKDRGKVFDIVRQINLDSGQRDGFIAEVVSWETHSRPAAGEYAQSVINEQFPEDIDIFLGMMGTYFGTPTKHWGSGTEEEFRLAYDRWKQKKSPEIMFYFSDALTSIRQIDPEQLEKRNSFQKEIATLGIYYFIYTDIVEFQFDLHNHISAAIHVVLNRKNTCKKEDVIPEESASSLMAYNELLKDDPIVNAVSLIGRSAAHMEEYSKILVGLNSDISRLSRAAIKEAKHIKNAVETKNEIKIIKSIGKVTDEMSLYSKGLIKKIPTLSEEFSESIMLILRASKIVKENEASSRFVWVCGSPVSSRPHQMLCRRVTLAGA